MSSPGLRDIIGYAQARLIRTNKYRGLTKIENRFEEPKGLTEAESGYVKTEEHIYARPLIRMIALVMLRLIQRKYVLRYPPEKENTRSRTYGISGERVRAAPRKRKVIPVNAGTYRFADVDDPDIPEMLRTE